MNELTQTIADTTGPEPGDCWRTSVACLLDLDCPADAPHFILHDDWWERTVAFVEQRRPGLTLGCYDPTFPVYSGDGFPFVIASGPSPRGDWLHAVIVSAVDGSLVWDPHPSRDGLAGEPVDIAALVGKEAS